MGARSADEGILDTTVLDGGCGREYWGGSFVVRLVFEILSEVMMVI
jgi:hypothetical protein